MTREREEGGGETEIGRVTERRRWREIGVIDSETHGEMQTERTRGIESPIPLATYGVA